MLEFLKANISNIIVLSIVILIVGAAVRKMYLDKKNGVSSCGGNCSGCGFSVLCSPEKKEENALLAAYRKDHPKQANS